MFHDGWLKNCNSFPTLVWNLFGSTSLSGIHGFCIVAVWELLKLHTFSYCVLPRQGLPESYESVMTPRCWCLSPQKQRIGGATLEIAAITVSRKRCSPALQLSRCFRGHSNRLLLAAYREKRKKRPAFLGCSCTRGTRSRGFSGLALGMKGGHVPVLLSKCTSCSLK